ncbi:unnamed protein product [Coffea canephora]|uniref:Disease resistance protein RGA3 n=1 Tax=Coffea canephora TaxID=49390 RepID=A0A068UU37_COFCA|nr:unnamed protein product [Coffea canephora]
MEAFVGILVDTLNSMIQKERGLLCGVATDMEKLARLLSTIKAVLEDAEQKQFTDKAIQLWFQELNGVAYEIDDVLDDYAAEASRVKYKNSGCFSLMCYPVAGNLMFRHRIGTRMKEILAKFKEIADERIKLGLSDHKRGSYFNASRETGSVVKEPDLVLGRDEEKDEIVRVLVNQVSDNQNVSVLPIVGVGGLGKTTLAQLVFNDQRITEHFKLKLWVWVSEDFDVKSIIKALIESEQGTSTGDLPLNALQIKLQSLLEGERYLIVLDDVWNENRQEWGDLKSVLACGSSGSSIIVTTRKKKVAEIMRTLKTHCLSSLSDDQCWSLFRQWAFDCQEKEERLEAVGKEIVKKCGGVPLAAKALGGFLRFKSEAEWNSVKCSELWNLPEDETGILPALGLSYLNLPVQLRRCFAYCAVFPKGSEIEREEVIHLWMANGLISSNERMEMEVEDVGDAVVTALHHRSLFQAVEKDEFGHVLIFKMHDLVHDLARSVMEAKLGGTESKRTMIKLKHLRHLDLSESHIVELPNSICDLWNLQILNLNYCGKLRSLPKGMRFLRNLRHLCLRGCWSLTHMPSGIGKLTCLRTLSMVVLSGKKGFRLSELRDLNMLRGELTIGYLERIEDKKDAEEACLIEKQSLRELYLVWHSERTLQRYNDEEVLKALKPCPSLQYLSIRGFKGSSLFPAWISTVKKVVVNESAAEYIVGAQESTAAAAAMSLSSLKQLALRDMPNLKGMLGREVQGTPGVFSQLQSLSFAGCPTLTLPLPRMPSLKELCVTYCGPNVAWASISNLTSLNSLHIRETAGLSCFPEEMLQNLSLLESLDLWWVRDLRALPRSLASLTALKTLSITHSPELESLPEEGLRGLASLQELHLDNCPNLLETLPSSIQMMTTLQSLTILHCDLLGLRCERGGEEWHKIKHIPHLQIW